jgi:hypothetical protein
MVLSRLRLIATRRASGKFFRVTFFIQKEQAEEAVAEKKVVSHFHRKFRQFKSGCTVQL